MKFIDVFYVGCGGFLGAVCRYIVAVGSRLLMPASSFPLGTFVANMLGCLLIGFAAGLIEYKNWWPEHIRLMILVGFLGGFTTYSSFAHETWQLFKADQVILGVVNVGVKVFLGLLLVGVGYSLSKLA